MDEIAMRAETLRLLKNHPPEGDSSFAFPVRNLATGLEGFVFKAGDTFLIMIVEDGEGEFIRIKDIKNRIPVFSGSLEALIKEKWVLL